jgi:formate-dependent nitrite reductase membrane component NrfD
MVTGRGRGLGRAGRLAAAALAPAVASYTGVLLADTAIPAWHEAHRELPYVFAGSAATAAGGFAMALAPVDQAGPARRMAVAGAAIEIVAAETLRRRLGMVGEPYHEGRPGTLMKVSRTTTAVAAGATVLVGGRFRAVSVLAGAACVAASVMTRFGIFEAGIASAEDPKYTVVPQRQRLRQRVEQRQSADT